LPGSSHLCRAGYGHVNNKLRKKAPRLIFDNLPPLDTLQQLVDEWLKSKSSSELELGRDAREAYSVPMKTLLRSLFVVLVLFTASLAFGAFSPVKVTVFNSSGAVAFTGTTDSNGTFATPSLAPGRYIVQFNSRNLQDNSYAVVISAGNKKVVANTVSGQQFAGGGVAMRVSVGGGLSITGNVIPATNADGSAKIMVWVPQILGSSMPAHWAEQGSADEMTSRTRGIIHRYSLVKMQDHNDRGL
jgi:hypothetical protein